MESIVPERAFETPEESAQAFFLLSLGVLGVAGLGLLGGRVGSGARYAAALGTLALVVAGYNVGHSGGALVYTYGAASAYTNSSGTMPAAANGGEATGSQASEADDDH